MSIKENDIQTSYAVAVVMNDKEYKLQVRDTTKKDDAELDKWREQKTAKYQKRDEILAKLTQKRDDFKFNNIILSDENFKGDISALCLEQKQLNKDIQSLQSELDDCEDVEDTNSMLEELMEKRLRAILSGDDKEALFEATENHGVKYTFLAEVISKKVQEAKEKK